MVSLFILGGIAVSSTLIEKIKLKKGFSEPTMIDIVAPIGFIALTFKTIADIMATK